MTHRPPSILPLVPLLLLLPVGCASLSGAGAGGAGTGGVKDWSEESAAPPAERLVLVTFEQDPAPAGRRAGSTPRGYTARAGYAVTTAAAGRAADLARRHDLTRVDAWPIEPLGVHCVVYRVPDGRTVDEMVRRLESEPEVESVQPMHRFELRTRPAVGAGYDDPYLPLQHGLRALGAEEAHRWASGSGVAVAVIDTAVDTRHPDLAGRVRVVDFVHPGAGPPEGEAHGTAVSGIIVSSANNGLGIVGVAPRAELLALRACWQSAPGEPTCNSFTLARALAWVLAEAPRLPRVVNLSLTGPADPLLARLIRRATERGVAVVAAADDGDSGPGFPASMPQVIAVGAARSGAVPAAGAGAGWILAPADDILTTLPRGSWDFLSGSSLAAAHVSGVLALVVERAPELSPGELAELLRASVRPAALKGGWGASVNACAALAALGAELTCAAAEPAESPARPDPAVLSAG